MPHTRRTAAILVLTLTPTIAVFADSIRISNVNVIDVADGAVVRDQTLIVDGDRFTYVGPSSDAPDDSTTVQIDAEGAWALPGLWDMHVHLTLATESALPVLVANGVTHVRDMGGDWNRVRELRDEIAAGDRVGPQIIGCGRYLESPRWLERAKSFLTEERLNQRHGVGDQKDADAVVAKLAAEGVDFLKFRTVASREAYYAIANAAKRHGLPFAGHAPPPAISLTDAAEAGQASIEHYITGPGIKRLPDDRQDAFDVFIENNTHFVPTLISGYGFRVMPTEDVLAIIDDESNTIDPRRRYIAPALLDAWRAQMLAKSQENNRFDYNEIHTDNVALFREMHEAGVPLMVGTDLAGPNVYPGFSVHDEIAIFVEQLGMSPMDALRAATIVPARFAGLDTEFGAIAPGMNADVVLVEQNPLENIRSLRQVQGVVLMGAWHDPKELLR